MDVQRPELDVSAARLFAGQERAGSVAAALGSRLSQVGDPPFGEEFKEAFKSATQMSESEFEEVLDADPESLGIAQKWIRNWTASMCEQTGLQPGTSEFHNCQKAMQQRAASPVGGSSIGRLASSVMADDPLGAPLEHHAEIDDCGTCGSPGLAARVRNALERR